METSYGISSLSSIVSYGLSTIYENNQTLSSIVSYGLSTIYENNLTLSSIVSYGLSTIYEYTQTLSSSNNAEYDNANDFFNPNTVSGSGLQNIFSQYPLINTNASNSYRGDGVNITEIVNFIFKKQFGIANTSPYATYNNEYSLTSFTNSTKDRQFSQTIPFEYPIDIYEDYTFRNNMLNYNNDNNQGRYISSNYPYLVFYSNIIMSAIDEGLNVSFIAKNYNSTNNIISQNAVSYYYSRKTPSISEYSTNLYDNAFKIFDFTSLTELPFGNPSYGSWLFDSDSGVLTFYDDVDQTLATVNAQNPPRISFWRYEGLIGNNTIMNVVEF